jgi:hypothetical protein
MEGALDFQGDSGDELLIYQLIEKNFFGISNVL